MQIFLEDIKDNLVKKFFDLKTNKDLAELLEVNVTTLIYYAYRLPKDYQYTQFKIPKRNGQERIINAPISSLKILQKKLNCVLQNVYVPRDNIFAFTKGRNVIGNAGVHKNSKFILKIDLKDFFNQIHFGRIRGAFMSFPFNFNEAVATTLANLCTYNGRLPQGAPTSPMISNIICWSLDRELGRFTRKFKCKYSRYADDITISSNGYIFPEQIAQVREKVILGKELVNIIKRQIFEVNDEKVSLKRYNKRQIVTGLIVNNFVNVKREYVRQIRKDLFFWEKYGIEETGKRLKKFTYENPYKKNLLNYKWVIGGRLNFLRQVRSENNGTYAKLKRWFDYLELKDWLEMLKTSADYQDRGYSLENIFNKLFKINAIEVKEPFSRRSGADQIDGRIVLSTGDIFLIECKWTLTTDGINKELDAFQTKISERSGQDTKGIFISIAGWNDNAIKNLEVSKSKNIFLMSCEDLDLILSNRNMSVDYLLKWKLIELSSESKPYASAKEYLSETKFKDKIINH